VSKGALLRIAPPVAVLMPARPPRLQHDRIGSSRPVARCRRRALVYHRPITSRQERWSIIVVGAGPIYLRRGWAGGHTGCVEVSARGDLRVHRHPTGHARRAGLAAPLLAAGLVI
jgi:hypothetical protein